MLRLCVVARFIVQCRFQQAYGLEKEVVREVEKLEKHGRGPLRLSFGVRLVRGEGTRFER